MSEAIKQICANRKARYDYHLLETFEAGLVLVGTEVKSLRAGKANLKDSYGRIEGGEVWLVGVHISPYEQGTHGNHDPERPRKLLLSRREIKRLTGKLQEQGLTLVPLRLYFKGGWVKVELALAKGKRKYDKRETLRRKDQKREAEQSTGR